MLSESTAFGGYDVIIDDGGHTSHQMLTSIKVQGLAVLLAAAACAGPQAARAGFPATSLAALSPRSASVTPTTSQHAAIPHWCRNSSSLT